jgi:hypothetical protein
MVKKYHNHFGRSIFHVNVDNAKVATLEYKCRNICLGRIGERKLYRQDDQWEIYEIKDTKKGRLNGNNKI